MARNKVQFQKGLSEPEFERRYGAEKSRERDRAMDLLTDPATK